MANYNVDIAIAVKGSKELKAVRAETTALSKEITTLNRLANKKSKTLPNSFNSLNKVLGQAKGNLNRVALGTSRYFRAIADVIDKEERLSRAYKKQQTDFKVIERLRRKGLDINKQNIQQIRNELAAEIKLERAKRRTGKASIDKGMAGKLGGAASSAMIGGAFPLLFGQTGPAAVGGAVGGAAGGLIGGQFGFALSILGTAVGQLIDEQDKLDQSLLKISRSFINAGDSAGFTRENFRELKTVTRMTKDEALSAASAFARYGETGKAAAFIFGNNPNTFKNLAAMRDTKTLMTAILDEQNGLNFSQQIQLLREAKITSFKDIQLRMNRMILEQNYKNAVAQAQHIKRSERIVDLLKMQLKIFGIMHTTIDFDKLFPNFFKTSGEKVKERLAELKKAYEEVFEGLPEFQELMSKLNDGIVAMSYSIPGALDSVSAELKKLMSVGYMVTTVANTVGDAFGESFKGIVKGSMSAQQALTNLFNKTADAFLDMAAKMIAEQIKLKILGIGLHFFGSALDQGFASGRGATRGGTDRWGRDFDSEKFGIPPGKFIPEGKATGGPVSGGKPYIVGEKGPELFTPGISGGITPNHALGGSTTVVVNVDASGTSVQGDEPSGEELGRLIGAVVQSELIKEKRPGGLLS